MTNKIKIILLQLTILFYFITTSILAYGWLSLLAIPCMLYVHWIFEEVIEDEESDINNTAK